METLRKSEKSYALTVTGLYAAAIGLNLWVGYKLLQQTEEGQAVIAEIRASVAGKFEQVKTRFFRDLSSQLLIEEAEDIVRGAWSGE